MSQPARIQRTRTKKKQPIGSVAPDHLVQKTSQQIYERSIELKPTERIFHCWKGQVWQSFQKYTESIESFKEAQTLIDMRKKRSS